MFISLGLCKTCIILLFFRCIWQHRLSQPVAHSILLHYCPGGISAPDQKPFYWCKERDYKFIIIKATITRNYTRLHTTMPFPQTTEGIATALMNHWLQHRHLQPLEASPVSLELGILLLIRTGWKYFDSHKGIWTSALFSVTDWLWYRTFCGLREYRNGKLSSTYEAGKTLSITASSWTLHLTLSK
jgi:hypothetical protein